MWGDYYLNLKTKNASNKPHTSKSRPVAVQFMLDQIWKVYECTVLYPDDEAAKKIAEKMGVLSKVKNLGTGVTAAQNIMSNWMPLAHTVLSMAG